MKTELDFGVCVGHLAVATQDENVSTNTTQICDDGGLKRGAALASPAPGVAPNNGSSAGHPDGDTQLHAASAAAPFYGDDGGLAADATHLEVAPIIATDNGVSSGLPSRANHFAAAPGSAPFSGCDIGHIVLATLPASADIPATPLGGVDCLASSDAQKCTAINPTTQTEEIEGDLIAHTTHRAFVSRGLLHSIRETHRLRTDLMRARNRLTLQVKAICRRVCEGGDKVEAGKVYKAIMAVQPIAVLDAMTRQDLDERAKAVIANVQPLIDAREHIEPAFKHATKELETLAKELPIRKFVEETRGLGMLLVAQLVGETGDLGGYSNPAKVWKRMGLAVFDGERQRKCKNKEQAELHGYSPERRSLMWNIGSGIIKASIRVDKETGERKSLSPYGDLYISRIAWETAKGDPGETKDAQKKKASHDKKKARRYVEKRAIRDMWRAWRDSVLVGADQPSADAQNKTVSTHDLT